MDQGVLESTKRRYRKEVLKKLLLADTSAEDDPEFTIVEFWKKLNIKDAMFMIAKAWNNIPVSTLRASWNKLLVTEDAEGSVAIIPELLHTLKCIDGCGDCDEVDVREWITMDSSDQGYQLLDDDEIVRAVTDANTTGDTEEDEQCDKCDVEEVAIPSHGEVLDMLSKCLPWV